MFSFTMVLITVQVEPYPQRSNNQLVSLSQIKCVRLACAHGSSRASLLTRAGAPASVFLFLFTGLLLQTNPDGITADKLLFSLVVGALTTSIVGFTFYLFVRELFWQLMSALQEVEDEEAAEDAEWEEFSAEATLALVAAEAEAQNLEKIKGGGVGGVLARLRALSFCSKCGILVTVALALGLGLGLGLPKTVAAPSGPTRFTLVITKAALPGSTKLQLLVNGTTPGPTLRVWPRQRVQVTVINEVFDDGTTVHWHGMLQRNTPFMDGVPGLTQCPISNVPGNNTLVYDFTTDEPGTFWYHGHYNGQYTDGLYGALVVDDAGATFAAAAGGDVRAAYDSDTWIWQAADFYNEPALSLVPFYMSPASGGDEPMPDAIMVNGKRSGGALSYRTSRTTRQLVRVINTAAFSMWQVSVDGMPLVLTEVDGTPIEPLQLPYVVLNVAQRVSFVLDFSRLHPDIADSPAIFFRVDAMPSMYPSYDESEPNDGLYGEDDEPFETSWTGLIRFSDSAMPTYTDAPVLTLAPPADVNMQAARPYPPIAAPEPTMQLYLEIVFKDDGTGVNRAFLNGVSAPQFTAQQLAAPLLYTYSSAAGGPIAASPLNGSGGQPFFLPYNAVVEFLINNTARGRGRAAASLARLTRLTRLAGHWRAPIPPARPFHVVRTASSVGQATRCRGCSHAAFCSAAGSSPRAPRRTRARCTRRTTCAATSCPSRRRAGPGSAS